MEYADKHLEMNVHERVLYLKEAPTWVRYALINDIVNKWFLWIKNVKMEQWVPEYAWLSENIDSFLVSSLDSKLSNFHEFYFYIKS